MRVIALCLRSLVLTAVILLLSGCRALPSVPETKESSQEISESSNTEITQETLETAAYETLLEAQQKISNYMLYLVEDTTKENRERLAAQGFKGRIRETYPHDGYLVVKLDDISEENIAVFREYVCNEPFLQFRQAPEMDIQLE